MLRSRRRIRCGREPSTEQASTSNPTEDTASHHCGTDNEHHRERLSTTVSREMASKRHSTWSKEQLEMDYGPGLQPVVKLYKIDRCVESRLQVKMNSPDSARDISIKREEPEYHPHLNCVESRQQVQMNSPDPARPVSVKQEETEDQTNLNQCVESRLQVKLNSPDSARDIYMKREEPEDHPHFNILQVVVCKEELPTEQERSPSLLQEEPEPPHIKEEPEEILLPDGPMLTLLAVKSEVDDQDISSHCCEVKVERECHTEDGDDWETSGGVISQSSQTRVFYCSECSYALTSQVFLYKHIRRRHLDLYCQMMRTGQITSAACQQVTKSEFAMKQAQGTSQKGPLLKKTQSNTKYHCKQCNESFYRISSLDTLEENLHCNKSFSQSGNLTRHQLLHIEEGQRPYHCKQCNESFFRLSSLNTHERIHTLEKNISIVNSLTFF